MVEAKLEARLQELAQQLRQEFYVMLDRQVASYNSVMETIKSKMEQQNVQVNECESLLRSLNGHLVDLKSNITVTIGFNNSSSTAVCTTGKASTSAAAVLPIENPTPLPLPTINTDEPSGSSASPVPVDPTSKQPAAAKSSPEQVPPEYKMKRSIYTVADLWNEWERGVGDSPAVKTLEATWKTKWRKNPTESRFFNRRIVIIRKIQKLMKEENKTEEEAIEQLQTLIKSNGKTLDWLGKELRKEEYIHK